MVSNACRTDSAGCLSVLMGELVAHECFFCNIGWMSMIGLVDFVVIYFIGFVDFTIDLVASYVMGSGDNQAFVLCQASIHASRLSRTAAPRRNRSAQVKRRLPGLRWAKTTRTGCSLWGKNQQMMDRFIDLSVHIHVLNAHQ